MDKAKYSFVHLIMCPFTGVGINNGFRGQEWLDYRIKVFKEYTLKSLLNQTNKRFVLWLTFRPEEQMNVSVVRLLRYLQDKMAFIVTYDGLMYHDDKFNKDWKSRWVNMKRLFRNKSFGLKNLLELLYNKNRTLKERIGRATFELSKFLPDSDLVLLTRLDSDDMLHKEAVEEIQTQDEPEYNALRFQHGYVYNSTTGELAHWLPATNPPFHTIIFPADVFYNADQHLKYYGSFTTHEDIPEVFRSKELGSGKYCVLVHGKHISTNWDHPFRGNIIKKEKAEILKEFGI